MNPPSNRLLIQDVFLMDKSVPCQPLSERPANTVMKTILVVDNAATIRFCSSGILRKAACLGRREGDA